MQREREEKRFRKESTVNFVFNHFTRFSNSSNNRVKDTISQLFHLEKKGTNVTQIFKRQKNKDRFDSIRTS